MICTDSLSSLHAIGGIQVQLNNSIILEITNKYTNIPNGGKNFIFCWVPTHIDIKENQISPWRMAHWKPEKTRRISFISCTHNAYLSYTQVFVSWGGSPILYFVPPNSQTGARILLHCVKFNNIRKKVFNVSTLNELFRDINPNVVFQFLHQAGLYNLF